MTRQSAERLNHDISLFLGMAAGGAFSFAGCYIGSEVHAAAAPLLASLISVALIQRRQSLRGDSE